MRKAALDSYAGAVPCTLPNIRFGPFVEKHRAELRYTQSPVLAAYRQDGQTEQNRRVYVSSPWDAPSTLRYMSQLPY